MTNSNIVFNKEITPIQNREETQKKTPLNATKRSSSVGAAFKRLFSKSPEPVDVAQKSHSETSSSILGPETPETAAQRAGTRGRTPPQFVNTPSPLASIEILENLPNLSCSLTKPPTPRLKMASRYYWRG